MSHLIKELLDEVKELRLITLQAQKQSSITNTELEHFTIEDLATMLNCSQNTIRNIIKENEIKIFKYKGVVRIRKLNFERFINKNTI